MSLALKAKLNELAHILYEGYTGRPAAPGYDFSKADIAVDKKMWALSCMTYNFWHPPPKIRPPRKKVSK